MKKLTLLVAAAVTLVMNSCSVDTQSTYYKDAGSGMNMEVKLDQSLTGMLGNTDAVSNKSELLEGLSTDWKSIYDIHKGKDKKLNEKADSVKLLKKMFMKFNKNDKGISGFAFKYDHLLPGEIEQIAKSGKKASTAKQIGSWDGKTLTIDMADLSPEKMWDTKDKPLAENPPKTKKDSLEASGKKMVEGMMGMLKLFDVEYTNRLKFENKIKTVTGKNDFLKQIDDKTLELHYRLKDFTEGKVVQNKDSKITVTTE